MSHDEIEKSRLHTETESKVLTMWIDILQQTQIGIHDDFLTLGGDSLSAMLCISRVRIAFGVELSMEDFFVEPATIAALATIIDETRVRV